MLIRRATDSDLSAIIHLLTDDLLGSNRESVSLEARGLYESAFRAIDRDASHELVILEHEGQVAGTLQLSVIPSLSRQGALRGQIESVRVRSDLRGCGLGSALVKWAINRSREKGCRLVQLTSDKERTDTHRFYRSLGFEMTHEGFKLLLPYDSNPQCEY